MALYTYPLKSTPHTEPEKELSERHSPWGSVSLMALDFISKKKFGRRAQCVCVLVLVEWHRMTRASPYALQNCVSPQF